jgi:hypothetical protein
LPPAYKSRALRGRREEEGGREERRKRKEGRRKEYGLFSSALQKEKWHPRRDAGGARSIFEHFYLLQIELASHNPADWSANRHQ